MTDPPFESDLAEVLSTAGSAHHEYEQTALKGVHDGLWAGFYAAFALGRAITTNTSDGSAYPQGLPGSALTMPDRLLAAAVGYQSAVEPLPNCARQSRQPRFRELRRPAVTDPPLLETRLERQAKALFPMPLRRCHYRPTPTPGSSDLHHQNWLQLGAVGSPLKRAAIQCMAGSPSTSIGSP